MHRDHVPNPRTDILTVEGVVERGLRATPRVQQQWAHSRNYVVVQPRGGDMGPKVGNDEAQRPEGARTGAHRHPKGAREQPEPLP